MREAFPDIVVKGCLFHFGQSLWRNIVNKGLRADNLDIENYEVRQDLLQLMASPFLPEDDILEITYSGDIIPTGDKRLLDVKSRTELLRTINYNGRKR